MRNLNRKQKNVIRKYIKKTFFDTGIVKPYFFNCECDLSTELYWKLFRLNEFENFNSCVDSFVDDIKTIENCKVI
jgi:hypothetical protein